MTPYAARRKSRRHARNPGMGKLSTDELRPEVARLAASRIDDIMSEFVPGTEDRAVMLANVSDPKNWKRIQKYRDDNDLVDNYGLAAGSYPAGSRGWMRVFDCKPLDDQLRAYVVTDPDDKVIVSCEFEGE